MSKTFEFPIDLLEIQFRFTTAKMDDGSNGEIQYIKICFWSTPKSFGIPITIGNWEFRSSLFQL